MSTKCLAIGISCTRVMNNNKKKNCPPDIQAFANSRLCNNNQLGLSTKVDRIPSCPRTEASFLCGTDTSDGHLGKFCLGGQLQLQLRGTLTPMKMELSIPLYKKDTPKQAGWCELYSNYGKEKKQKHQKQRHATDNAENTY